MRYVVALAIVGAVIAVICLCADSAASALQKRMHQRMIDAQAAGQIPADVDLNREDFADFGTEVSDSEMFQIGLLDFWYAYRPLLIPLLIACGLIISRLLPSK